MSSQRTPGDGPPPILGRTELIATAFLILGVVLIVGGVILFAGGGGDDDGGATDGGSTVTAAPGDTSAAASSTSAPFSPVTEDDNAIAALARKSIEVLPAGQWPTLYDDFTADFQARCSLDEFTQAGIEGANALGGDLPLLGYVAMEGVQITGDAATGTIIGELRGQSQYRVEAAFAKVDGVWKLTPAAGTTGCSAFNRLEA